jgi:uncharacterized protein YqgC (DUF456 family)
MILGILGNVLPFLPGTPICYLALLLQQFRTIKPFSTTFMVLWAIVVVLVIVLDYLTPIYGTKKFGGSKYGVWGCTVGFLAAFWMGPIGIIIGPFIGAFIGELIAGQEASLALRAAVGSFAGFLFGTMIKLIVSAVMAWYFFEKY